MNWCQCTTSWQDLCHLYSLHLFASSQLPFYQISRVSGSQSLILSSLILIYWSSNLDTYLSEGRSWEDHDYYLVMSDSLGIKENWNKRRGGIRCIKTHIYNARMRMYWESLAPFGHALMILIVILMLIVMISFFIERSGDPFFLSPPLLVWWSEGIWSRLVWSLISFSCVSEKDDDVMWRVIIPLMMILIMSPWESRRESC